MTITQKAMRRLWQTPKETILFLIFFGFAFVFVGLTATTIIRQNHTETASVASVDMLVTSDALLKGRGEFLGNKQASFTLIEFGDYECPPCREHQAKVLLLLRRHSSNLRLDFRHLPLSTIHMHAMDAAMGAEHARRSGNFWNVHQALFRSEINAASIDAVLHHKGIKTKLDNSLAEKAVFADITLAKKLDISSTPTFLLCQPDKRVVKLSSIDVVDQFLKSDDKE